MLLLRIIIRLLLVVVALAIFLSSCSYLIAISNVEISAIQEEGNMLKGRLLSLGLVNENTFRDVPHEERCPMRPPGLVGRTTVEDGMTEDEVEKNMTQVFFGGHWWPSDCVPIWKIAIIVPYRNRDVMVGPFLNHMHPFLQRQLLNYTIFFVEQSQEKEFNRAKLLNIGYALSQKYGPWDCYAFHDVDCIPENDYNLYYCPEQPRHLGIAMEKFKYKLLYGSFFGCACIMSDWQVKRVNGWSNKYFGWGGEDDDMYQRVHAEGMKVWRVPESIATYATLKHKQAKGNPERMKILKEVHTNYKTDGINSLDFNLTSTSRRKLYTKFLVDI